MVLQQTTWGGKQRQCCGFNWMPHLVAERYQHLLNVWPCFCHQGSWLWNVQPEEKSSFKSLLKIPFYRPAFISCRLFLFLSFFQLFYSFQFLFRDVVCYRPVTPMIVFVYITFVWFCRGFLVLIFLLFVFIHIDILCFAFSCFIFSFAFIVQRFFCSIVCPSFLRLYYPSKHFVNSVYKVAI